MYSIQRQQQRIHDGKSISCAKAQKIISHRDRDVNIRIANMTISYTNAQDAAVMNPNLPLSVLTDLAIVRS
jgi:hypothetical protein